MPRIALAQIDTGWKQPGIVCERMAQAARRAQQEHCDILLLPEMFATGFCMEPEHVCEPEDGPIHSAVSALASTHNLWIIAGIAERSGNGRYYNSACLFSPSGTVSARYRKQRLFPLAHEDRCFSAGESSITTPVSSIPAGIFLCYDLRFPELFRSIAPHVALMVVLANWPASRCEHWRVLLRARAIENQCFVAGVNRVGVDGNGIVYNGNSCIVDPMGQVLLAMPEDERFGAVSIDAGLVNRIRHQYPFGGCNDT